MRPGARPAGALLLWACLSPAAAGCGEEPPAATAPAPAPAAPETPRPALPPLPELRTPEASEVDAETFLKLEDPAEPPLLRWSFPAGRRWSLRFTQTIQQVVSATRGGTTTTVPGRDRNRGSFEFVGKGDGSAGVLVTIQTAEVSRDGKEVPREALEQQPPSRFEAVLREDGRSFVKSSKGGADARIFLDILLAMQEGERTIDDGRISTRRTGTYKVAGRTCVRLESEFETSAGNDDGRRLMRGRVISYFDAADGRFVRASAAVAASLRQVGKDARGAWAVQSIDSRTAFRAELSSP